MHQGGVAQVVRLEQGRVQAGKVQDDHRLPVQPGRAALHGVYEEGAGRQLLRVLQRPASQQACGSAMSATVPGLDVERVERVQAGHEGLGMGKLAM